MLSLAVIGSSEETGTFLKTLAKLEDARVKSVVTADMSSPAAVAARSLGIPVSDCLSDPDTEVVDLVIDTEARCVFSPKGESTSPAKAAELLLRLAEKLDQIEGLNEGLSAILDSVEEGIQVVDAQGVTKYMNPAGVRILGLHPNKVIGRPVSKYSPDGSLVRVLTTGQSVFGVFNRPQDTGAYVVSNASPLMANGKLIGAVATFKDVADIIALARNLKRRDPSPLLGDIDLASARYTFDDIKGSSDSIRRTVRMAQVAARTDSTILILGETGTGKELFAHAIHSASPRKRGPFIRVNCAAVPETLLESEFFGCEKGAYTGADRARPGKFELADGGTILLDEIGDMSLALQAKLLRVLQDREVQRLGGSKLIKVDVRVIASTSKPLCQLMAAGSFRKDLFYRLSVINIVIPPLQSRKEDIPELCQWILYKLNRRLGKEVTGLSDKALELLKCHDWPGNVRELENALERAVIMCQGEMITEDLISITPDNYEVPSMTADPMPTMNLKEIEKQLITSALARFGTSLAGKRKAAEALGISLATMYNKAKKYGLLNR